MKTPLLLVALFFACASMASAWGNLGHQTIGVLGLQVLQNENPAEYAKVEKLLGGQTPQDAATWMDDLKRAKKGTGPLKQAKGEPDNEATIFNRDFPDNHEWHFDNLPLGETKYTDDDPFSAPNDIVHEINIAISVLEGKSTVHTPVQALRMIIHFTGDIHQPLHVGTGYYKPGANGAIALVKDPALAAKLPMDVGGNDILLPGVPDDGPYAAELHSFWDTNLVADSAHTSSAKKYAKALAARYPTNEWKTSGDYHAWAEAWATESVALADSAAYDGINPTQGTVNTAGTSVTASVTLPENYEENNTVVAEKQIVKAAYRLADLLGEIKYAK